MIRFKKKKIPTDRVICFILSRHNATILNKQHAKFKAWISISFCDIKPSPLNSPFGHGTNVFTNYKLAYLFF